MATLAIARGLWAGPAILIAPAYKRAVGHARDPAFEPSAVYTAIAQQLATDDRRIIIVHGTNDDTIPIADSREMADAIGAEMIEIEDGDHRMRCLMEGESPQLLSLIERVQHPKRCGEDMQISALSDGNRPGILWEVMNSRASGISIGPLNELFAVV